MDEFRVGVAIALGTESLEDRRLLSGAGTLAEELPSSEETQAVAAPAPAIVQLSVVSSDETARAPQSISPAGEETETSRPRCPGRG